MFWLKNILLKKPAQKSRAKNPKSEKSALLWPTGAWGLTYYSPIRSASKICITFYDFLDPVGYFICLRKPIQPTESFSGSLNETIHPQTCQDCFLDLIWTKFNLFYRLTSRQITSLCPRAKIVLARKISTNSIDLPRGDEFFRQMDVSEATRRKVGSRKKFKKWLFY